MVVVPFPAVPLSSVCLGVAAGLGNGAREHRGGTPQRAEPGGLEGGEAPQGADEPAAAGLREGGRRDVTPRAAGLPLPFAVAGVGPAGGERDVEGREK